MESCKLCSNVSGTEKARIVSFNATHNWTSKPVKCQVKLKVVLRLGQTSPALRVRECMHVIQGQLHRRYFYTWENVNVLVRQPSNSKAQKFDQPINTHLEIGFRFALESEALCNLLLHTNPFVVWVCGKGYGQLWSTPSQPLVRTVMQNELLIHSIVCTRVNWRCMWSASSVTHFPLKEIMAPMKYFVGSNCLPPLINETVPLYRTVICRF